MMRRSQDNGFFKKISGTGFQGNTLYGESFYPPPHFFHVTYSKYNKLWYVKEIEGPTCSVHTSCEKALREARELAHDDDNGQIVLHHEDGVLEIIRG